MSQQPYTPIPNWLIEAMPEMSDATFRIACHIARQTVGYDGGNGDGSRREWDTISLSAFMAATGMSRQGVLNGIENGLNKWFKRRADGASFSYRLVNEVDQQPAKVVNEVDQSTTLTSQRSRPEVVNEVDQQPAKVVNDVDQQVVNDVDHIKKIYKERTTTKKGEKNIPSAQPKDTRTAQAPILNSPICHTAPRTPQQEMYAALCDIMALDYHIITDNRRVQIAQTVRVLWDGGYRVTDLERFLPEVWANDWRWQKSNQTQRPTLTQIREEIGKLRAPIPVDMPTYRNDNRPRSRHEQNMAAFDEFEQLTSEKGIEIP